ncbi:PTS transporter subunit EIIB [Azospirillum thermophilum]|uniref:PTS glucose transporter subunit IIB n=1 Tax=Azospirillum thermophilum TaxID=2202148 RepID=A0A2S2CVF0_9PROT|nr:PTS transporter subunit EIIB [Azospirillum thermophilum]AWK88456.1 PTS glucose transporter subunit IIB [Azospirillum thermophilum]
MSAFSFLKKIGLSLAAPESAPAPAAAPAAAQPEAAAPATDDDGAALRRAAGSPALRKALGGEANIKAIEPIALTRLRVELLDGGLVDQEALGRAGVLAVATLAAGTLHLIVGLPAEQRQAA